MPRPGAGLPSCSDRTHGGYDGSEGSDESDKLFPFLLVNSLKGAGWSLEGKNRMQSGSRASHAAKVRSAKKFRPDWNIEFI